MLTEILLDSKGDSEGKGVGSLFVINNCDNLGDVKTITDALWERGLTFTS